MLRNLWSYPLPSPLCTYKEILSGAFFILVDNQSRYILNPVLFHSFKWPDRAFCTLKSYFNMWGSECLSYSDSRNLLFTQVYMHFLYACILCWEMVCVIHFCHLYIWTSVNWHHPTKLPSSVGAEPELKCHTWFAIWYVSPGGLTEFHPWPLLI